MSQTAIEQHSINTDSPAPNKHNDTRVILYSLIIALAACAYGFDLSETGGFLAMSAFNRDFGDYQKTTQTYALSAHHQTLMYGVEVFFIIIGGTSAGYVSKFYGRKFGLYLAAATTIVGAALQMVQSYIALVFGRSIMGISVGLAASFAIAYWSEIAPPQLRGVLVAFYQFFLNLANFVGSCIDQGTHGISTPWAYRIPLCTMMIPALLIIATVWMVPESPRWLIARDENDKARANLRKIRGPSYSENEINKEINDSIKFTALEAHLHATTSYMDCFKGADKRRTLIAIMCGVGEQFMGVGFLGGYATLFFALVGLTDAFIVTVIASAMSIGGTLLGFPLLRLCGRRRCMIAGAAICSFCMLAFAAISDAHPGSPAAAKCLIAFICIFNFVYSATWGPMTPVIMGEVPSNRLRSKTVSLAVGSSMCIALVVITSTPYLIDPEYAGLGTKMGYIFGGLTVLVVIGTVCFLPETKDRTLEEIDEMFLNRIPTRDFRKYICGQAVAGFDLTNGVTEKTGVSELEVVIVDKTSTVV